MPILAAPKSAFSIQADRALYYGRWLLLGFAAAVVSAPILGPITAWLCFAIWAMLCGVAARRGHMLAWAVLCLTPLAMISTLWLIAVGSDDMFGLRWVYIAFFVGACMVTAATGILTLLPRDAAPTIKGNNTR